MKVFLSFRLRLFERYAFIASINTEAILSTHHAIPPPRSQFREHAPSGEANATGTCSKVSATVGGIAYADVSPIGIDGSVAPVVPGLRSNNGRHLPTDPHPAAMLAHGATVGSSGGGVATLPTLTALIEDAIERGALVEITHGALDRANAGCAAVLMAALEDYHHCDRVVIPEDMRAAALAQLLNLGWDARDARMHAEIEADRGIWIGAAVAEARREGGCV